MGQKTSVLKVKSEIAVTCGCGTVDAIRLSYGRRSCCGPKRRAVASFTFPRKKWVQMSPQDMPRNCSAEVATVHVGKLMEKDGHTPVRVTCLAGKVSVFRAEMSLADLLARLKCTEGGGKAVLSFSLAGTGAEHAFTVMFCNGKKLVNGGTEDTMVHQVVTPDPGVVDQDYGQEKQGMEEVMDGKSPSVDVDCETEKDDVMGEEDPSLNEEWVTEEEVVDGENPSLEKQSAQDKEGVMGEEDPSLDVGWVTEDEEEVMGEEDPSLTMEWMQEKAMKQEVRHRGKRPHKTPPTRTTVDDIPRGEGPVRRTMWDHVADCAGVVALGLVLYHTWVQYSAYW